eukprot:TRINITY_DN1834_c0_g1_i1.p1 TRINITY_DN1834_c0_g1~~TRINITY_DN1834_c0_g1_i1.p1  ORF type:complete len:728 (-),score=228.55 TRINITY_DN1834_c0_g1_i1:84-2267(-)
MKSVALFVVLAFITVFSAAYDNCGVENVNIDFTKGVETIYTCFKPASDEPLGLTVTSKKGLNSRLTGSIDTPDTPIMHIYLDSHALVSSQAMPINEAANITVGLTSTTTGTFALSFLMKPVADETIPITTPYAFRTISLQSKNLDHVHVGAYWSTDVDQTLVKQPAAIIHICGDDASVPCVFDDMYDAQKKLSNIASEPVSLQQFVSATYDMTNHKETIYVFFALRGPIPNGGVAVAPMASIKDTLDFGCVHGPLVGKKCVCDVFYHGDKCDKMITLDNTDGELIVDYSSKVYAAGEDGIDSYTVTRSQDQRTSDIALTSMGQDNIARVYSVAAPHYQRSVYLNNRNRGHDAFDKPTSNFLAVVTIPKEDKKTAGQARTVTLNDFTENNSMYPVTVTSKPGDIESWHYNDRWTVLKPKNPVYATTIATPSLDEIAQIRDWITEAETYDNLHLRQIMPTEELGPLVSSNHFPNHGHGEVVRVGVRMSLVATEMYEHAFESFYVMFTNEKPEFNFPCEHEVTHFKNGTVSSVSTKDCGDDLPDAFLCPKSFHDKHLGNLTSPLPFMFATQMVDMVHNITTYTKDSPMPKNECVFMEKLASAETEKGTQKWTVDTYLPNDTEFFVWHASITAFDDSDETSIDMVTFEKAKPYVADSQGDANMFWIMAGVTFVSVFIAGFLLREQVKAQIRATNLERTRLLNNPSDDPNPTRGEYSTLSEEPAEQPCCVNK